MPQLRSRRAFKKAEPDPLPKDPSDDEDNKDAEQEEDEGRGLTELQKAHLLVDLDTHAGFQFQHIVKLNFDYYHQNYQAFRNRHQHLKRIKVDKNTKTNPKKKKKSGPALCFELLGKAKSLLEKTKKEGTFDPHYDTDDPGKKEEVVKEDQPPAPNSATDEDSSVASASSPARKKKPRKPFASPSRIMAKSVASSSSKNSKKSMKSMGSPAGKKQALPRKMEFETVKDAEEAVGPENAIYVDLENPHKHLGPLFFVHLSVNCFNEAKTAVFDKIRILLPTVFDTRDLERVSGKQVCGGAAFIVYMCSVAAFLVEDHAVFHEKSDPAKCAPTKISHSSHAEAIKDDEEERTTAYLFVMPEGVTINTDLEDFEEPTGDQEVRIQMCRLPLLTTIDLNSTQNKKKKKTPTKPPPKKKQNFEPGYFELRISKDKERAITAPAVEEDEDDDDDEHGLSGYFAGALKVTDKGEVEDVECMES